MFRESSGVPLRTRHGFSRGEDQQSSPLLRTSPNSPLASSGFAGSRFSVEVTEKQCRQPISDYALPRLASPFPRYTIHGSLVSPHVLSRANISQTESPKMALSSVKDMRNLATSRPVYKVSGLIGNG